MRTETRVTVNGRPEADHNEAPAPTTYLVIRDGAPVDAIMWDGVSDYDPGDGAELVLKEEWKGPEYHGPQEAPEARAKRTTTERLDTLIGNLRDDLKAFDGMTAGQRQAAQRRTLRAVILLARVVRDDHTGEVE